jgi:hypothetical protein
VERPKWVLLGEQILGPLLKDTQLMLKDFKGEDYHVLQIPVLALYHLTFCLESSMDANEKGHHTVALSLIRQSVEAITIVELGLCNSEQSYNFLVKWNNGKISQGEIRKQLENHVWPMYGKGLWKENWASYFASLAKAVQPYAHCSPELLQWNLTVLKEPVNKKFIVKAGDYDPIKASRITLLHVLLIWTLGRLLSANQINRKLIVSDSIIQELGKELAKSKFLIHEGDWAINFWPHMFFRQ